MNIKKRIIFSRHNIRYPLFSIENMEKELGTSFVNWKFTEKDMGKLTKKGQLLEVKFGQDLKEIYKDEIDYVFTNSMERTYLTAKSFLLGYEPFKNLDINMKYDNFDKMDLQFSIIFDKGYNIRQEKLDKIDKDLYTVYTKMEEILKLEKGSISNKKTYFYVDDKGYLHVRGALKLATDICDLFILMYYEKFDEKEIFESNNFFEDLKFMAYAKDKFLDEIFADEDFLRDSKENVYILLEKHLKSKDKNVLIVGHDSNLCSIMKTLGIDYSLNENMIEKYPISAKLVFEIYEDNSFDLFYVYYHYETMRNMENNKPIIQHIYKGKL